MDPTAPPDVTIVILTYNEEVNIARALTSVCGWAKDVLVLDSFSDDRTLEIAKSFPCRIFQNKFVDFSRQFSHALTLPIATEWVFILAADEVVPPDLREEISRTIAAKPAENGFFCRFRFIWLGKWIQRGYYGAWVMRLFRWQKAKMESREVNEHFLVETPHGHLQADVIHDDHKGVSDWIAKHNRYASAEARLLCATSTDSQVSANLFGNQTERKRWIRHKVWNRLPPLIRPWFYFAHRYVFSGAFLEGKEAFSYHVLQALWFQTLIDVKYLELLSQQRAEK